MRFVLGPDKIDFLFKYYFNIKFKKINFGGKELFRIRNPITVTVRRTSRNTCCQPRLPVTTNVAVGSTVRFFFREVLAQKLGSHQRNGFLPGMTSSWMRNPPDE
jgi:hypothetical protein